MLSVGCIARILVIAGKLKLVKEHDAVVKRPRRKMWPMSKLLNLIPDQSGAKRSRGSGSAAESTPERDDRDL